MDVPHGFVERIVDEDLKYQGSTISVRHLTVETAPGVRSDFEIVEKGGDSVAVLPVDTAGQIHIIKEYYPAADARLFSLPKGTIEPGEKPAAAALREMKEEVGFTGRLVPLANFHVSPGYLRQRTVVFVAFDLEPASAAGDERTYIEPVRLEYNQALNMVHSGEISEARLVAALLLAQPIIATSK